LNKPALCAIDRPVNSRVPFLRLLAVLGLMALLGAQVFGLTRGYQCDCTGRVEWTAQDHCHGPHDAGCHEDEPLGHIHDEGDGPGERHEHQEVRDDAEARSMPGVTPLNFVPVLLAVFEDERRWTETIVPKTPSADLDVGTGPPPGVAVARTTVLLI
jgi:hypothetical protein